MIDKVKRDLDIIASELQAALRREADEVINIGNLLGEAKEQLKHGEWLPWLKANFGSSIRSAQNYMAVARFAAKYATVAHLRLRPSALFLLASEALTSDEIEAVLKAAETEWVDYERASEIMNLLRWRDTTTEEERAEEERSAEAAEETLAGPPPGLPPPPEPSPTNFALQEFDEAVATLLRLQTRLTASFAATTHGLEVFNTVQEFLGRVAGQLEKQ